jgi:aminoglycoside phosphotransferase family enzyme/predicted kinase
MPDVPVLAALPALDATARLVQALRDPACYPHPVGRVEVRETHISYVLLAGEFAYKVKKPVTLPFLDFSTRVARHYYCHEELRLNARTARALYLDVVPITPGPRVAGTGEAIEHALRMRRFPDGALLGEHARAGTLEPGTVDAFARRLAAFHAAADRQGSRHLQDGAWARARASALANFREMKHLDPPNSARLLALRAWTEQEIESSGHRFEERAHEGFVRECHGDVHLDNVALVDGEPLMFDCIEFSAAMRTTDVAADVAFAAMDLDRHGYAGLRARFLDRYLEASGDHGMLAVLRFYEVYRAMVRAKISLLRRAQSQGDPAAARAAEAQFESCLRVAERRARRAPPRLLLMHGPSGSGKTVVAGELLEAAGAIRLRSDVERKRLHGLAPLEHAGAAPGAGIYGAAAAHDTYERLAVLAREALAAGYPVIVDATFLRRADRERFGALASRAGAQLRIAACTASAEVLRERVRAREQEGADASDAGVAVLEDQLRNLEPVDEPEAAAACRVDTSEAPARAAAVLALARWLGADGG